MKMDRFDHLRYHLEVSLDCGECTLQEAIALHAEAMVMAELGELDEHRQVVIFERGR